MAEKNPPWALQGGTVNHDAITARRAFAGLFSEGIAGFNASGDLKVTQSGTPGMSVVVARGGAYVKGDDATDQGLYFVYNDADKTLTVPAAHATLARKDIVVFHVYDNFHGQPGDTSTLEYIAGTPAGSPAEPTLPASAYKLATVDVPAADTSITNSQITDRRSVASLLTGAIIVPSARVYRSSTQAIPDSTSTAINFNAEDYDTLGMHSGSSSQVTVPVGAAGKYFISGQVDFAANATGRRSTTIFQNGAQICKQSALSVGGTASTSLGASTVVNANDGDFFEVFAFHTAGGSLNALNGTDSTWLSVIRVG